MNYKIADFLAWLKEKKPESDIKTFENIFYPIWKNNFPARVYSVKRSALDIEKSQNNVNFRKELLEWSKTVRIPGWMRPNYIDFSTLDNKELIHREGKLIEVEYPVYDVREEKQEYDYLIRLSNQVKNLEKKIFELEDQWIQEKSTGVAEIEYLKGQITVKEQELNKVRDESSSTTAFLRKQLSELRDELVEAKNKNTKIIQLERELTEIKGLLQIAKDEKDLAETTKENVTKDLQAIISSLTTKVAGLEIELKSKEQLLLENQKKQLDLSNKLKNLLDGIQSLKKEKTTSSKEKEEAISKLKQEIKSKESEYQSLLNEFNQKKEELNSLQSSIAGERSVAEVMRDGYQSQSSQRQALEKQLEELSLENHANLVQISNLKREIDKLTTQLKNKTTKLNNLNTKTTADLVAERTAKQEAISKLQIELDHQKELNRLSDEKLKQEIKDKESKYNDLLSEFNEKAQQLDSVTKDRNRLSNLSVLSKEQTNQIKVLEKEQEKLKQENQTNLVQISHLKQEITKLTEELSNSQKEQEKINSLEEQFKEVESKLTQTDQTENPTNFSVGDWIKKNQGNLLIFAGIGIIFWMFTQEENN